MRIERRCARSAMYWGRDAKVEVSEDSEWCGVFIALVPLDPQMDNHHTRTDRLRPSQRA